MEKTILQIESIEAQTLLNRFEGLEKQIHELKEATKPQPQTDYITRRDVSEMFKISLVTVHDWTRKGIITAYKIGNRIFFKRHEIENALTKTTRLNKS